MTVKYDNSGSLFKNDRKTMDRHPDMRGKITVEGTEYWLSAWTKVGQRGKFLSLSVQKVDGNQSAQPRGEGAVTLDTDIDDSIPW